MNIIIARAEGLALCVAIIGAFDLSFTLLQHSVERFHLAVALCDSSEQEKASQEGFCATSVFMNDFESL
jgi:hypothetical protein